MKLLIIFFTFSSICFADCNKLMRIEMLKRKGITPEYLLEKNEGLVFPIKDKQLHNKISKIGTTYQEVMADKKGENPKKLMQAFEEKVFEKEIDKSLSTIWKGINTPKTFKSWVRNLTEASIFEIYLSNQYSAIKRFENTKTVPEEFVLLALQRRLRRGGFDTRSENIEKVYKGLGEKEFADLLKNRKTILDLAFKGKSHGHFIHMFQVDFMIYILKSKGMDPSRVGEVYQWMGERHFYELIDGERINSLNEGWFNFFDSFELDMTQPEVINPWIERYLGWRL